MKIWQAAVGASTSRPSRAIPFRNRWLLAAFLLSVMLAVTLWSDGLFLASWNSQTVSRDLDGDGHMEELVLQWRRLQVLREGRVLFSTRTDWRVEDFLLGDVNGDEADELLLLVWKRGSYGDARPFWVKRDEADFSQHLYCYGWSGEWKPLWMSSRLRPEIREWALLEDGVLQIKTRLGENTRWKYGDWGFVRLDSPRIPF